MTNIKGKYILNVIELNDPLQENLEIYEIDFLNWDKKKDYNIINQFKSKFSNLNLLIESHGRYLILIPKNGFKINQELVELIKTDLEKISSKNVQLKKVIYPLKNIENDEPLYNVIRKGVGEILTTKIQDLGFKKIGSGGGIGKFSLPENWLGKNQKFYFQNASISRTIELTVFQSDSDSKWYLSADIKGRFEEEKTLSSHIQNYKRPIADWSSSEKIWQIRLNDYGNIIFPKEIEREFFEVQEVKNWNEICSLEIGYGKYVNRTWQDLINSNIAPTKLTQESYVLVKSQGRIIKDPNKKIIFPLEFFYKVLDSPEGEEYKERYKSFTQLTPQSRNEYISKFFQLLKQKGISKESMIFENFPINYARPGIGTNSVEIYGRAPPIHNLGVESWSNLKKIDIFYYNYGKISSKINEFNNNLKQQFENILKITAQRLKQKVNQIEIEVHPLTNEKFLNTQQLDKFDSSCCPIVFTGRKIRNYKEIKSKLTQERGIPVQVVQENTLLYTHNLIGLIRTIIPQLIAKTGGFPYKLYPPLLDKAIIIGLDKARDATLRRPSASAGIAAVTPEGQYISGASTPLENNTTDFIDVDKLAPILLQELDENKFNKNYDYVVILRDGSPRICRQEVPLWKKYLEEYGKAFIFISSRKTHPYRVFPIDITEQNSKARIDYSIPAILNSEPLPLNDFLVLAAKAPKGTPKPVLYTVMENTTHLKLSDIKEKVLAQIISMSMLCWESPLPTSQPLPLHYADKLAGFTQLVQQAWNSRNKYPMFI